MRKAYSENGKGVFEDPREVGECWMKGAGWVVIVCCLLASLSFSSFHNQTNDFLRNAAECGTCGGLQVQPVADFLEDAKAIASRRKQTIVPFSTISWPLALASSYKE